MKISEVEVGGRYLAKVSGKLTTVRVAAIRRTAGWPEADRTVLDVVNEATGRRTTFRSAAKLRRRVDQPPPLP